MNIFQRFLPAIAGTIISGGNPAVGAGIYSAQHAKKAEAPPASTLSENPPLIANTLDRKAQVRTVAFMKDGATQKSSGISPQMLMMGGVGIIVLILLVRGN